DQNQIMFSTDDIYIISRTINNSYLNYKQIIPTDFTTEVVVFKKDIINALKLVNIFTDKFHKINIKTDIINKTLELDSRNIDIGENTTNINAVIKGEEINEKFNAKYLLEGFQSINQDSVVLKYNSKQEVLIVQGVSDGSFVYLIKPINK
ncbi:DNA polymerase III subunit beta, partial [Patescibacteria group bacterium]|nr:DNA polymerase III subunit beta [Patescibacteria group bacterium]MBU1956327.1 DNA polymerase III subunit beta [Patescibacteria group bacterium]